MELVKGRTFDEYLAGRREIKSNRLELLHRLRIFSSICDAVNYAHQRSVIHRDLKPSNIVVVHGDEQTPLVKVLDFGLAREAEAAEARSEAILEKNDAEG